MEATSETTQSTPAAAALAAAVWSVLGDDDLLREILLRLGFPTSLVRAALVCRRWFRIASDRTFLRRFRDLHPPRLLGFYVQISGRVPEFVPVPSQPPELAAVLRRGSFSLAAYKSLSPDVICCRNGKVFIRMYRDSQGTSLVHSPLHPARGMVAVPPYPMRNGAAMFRLLSKVHGDQVSYFWFSMKPDGVERATAQVYMLQDDVWRLHTSVTTQHSGCLEDVLLVDDKVYMTVYSWKALLVLDLTSSSFFTIELPGSMSADEDIMMSQADDSGLYLVHLKDLKLSIWLYRGFNGNAGGWLLCDTICLRDMFASLWISPYMHLDEAEPPIVYLLNVGENAEFVFLERDECECVLYLDVKSRALYKVYNLIETEQLLDLHPLMMIWPPFFPALREQSCKVQGNSKEGYNNRI